MLPEIEYSQMVKLLSEDNFALPLLLIQTSKNSEEVIYAFVDMFHMEVLVIFIHFPEVFRVSKSNLWKF